MTGKYQSYPEYKDSGYEWLGNIPVDWSLSRHKFISHFQKGKNPSVLLDEPNKELVKYLSMDYLRGNAEPLYAEAENNSYVCSNGQILIIWDGSNAGEFVKGEEGIVSSTMAASELLADIDYNFYWYLCVCLEPEMRRHANGMGIPHVNGNELKDSVFPLPLKLEQEKIANFLDHETAKIDTLIEKQQQLIKLLKEKRQAVISHAVTKGLNPNAPMRDSGVKWLGEVPEHWSVLSLGKITLQKCDGPFGSGLKSEHYTDSGVRVIRLQNIKMGKYFDGESAFIDEEYYKNNLRNHDVEIGDVLIAGLGDPRNPVGRACIAPDDISPAMVKADCFRFRVDKAKVIPSFVAQQLSVSSFHDAGKLSNGSTRARIPLSLMTTRKIAICSKEEQQEILTHVDKLSSQYEQLELTAEKAIKLMQERRTALISAAVTGKIDVRSWQSTKLSTQEAINV